MIKLTLYTTRGCDSCRVMNNIVNRVIDNIKMDIAFARFDYENVPIEYIKAYNIKDFPTLILSKDDKFVGKLVGTASEKEVIDFINKSNK